MLRNVRSRRRDFPALYFLERIMSPLRIQTVPKMVAEAKHLLEETDTSKVDVTAIRGIGLDTLHLHSRERQCGRHSSGTHAGCGDPGNVAVGHQPHHESADESSAAARRRTAASRIMTMLEDELARIENTFKDVGACTEAAFDNRIRTLLGVTKALREVELISKSDEVNTPDAADNDATRDIDELREALARRIESFIAAQQSGVGGTDDGAVD
jgi:hypothetical protein